jgi:hypothetical protein
VRNKSKPGSALHLSGTETINPKSSDRDKGDERDGTESLGSDLSLLSPSSP